MAKCKNLVSGYKTFKNILLQNYSTEFLDYCTQIEQRQFEHSKFNANLWKSSSPKLLNGILRYCKQIL